MSRLLFTALFSNDLGLPSRTLPIALELAKRGHEVAFCNPEEAPRKLIAEAGLRNLEFGPRPIPTVFPPFTQRIWNMDHFCAAYGYQDEDFLRADCEGMKAVIANYAPDVIVDSWNLSATIAAKALRKPLVSIIQGDMHPSNRGFIWWQEPLPDIPTAAPVVNRVLTSFGLQTVARTEELHVGDLTLVAGTPETDPIPGAAGVVYIGPILWQKPDARLPDYVGSLDPKKPVLWVYTGNPRYFEPLVTWGDSIVVLRACLEALANEDVQVVLTTGYHDLPAEASSLPANFHYESYVPGIAMAQRSDLMIHHGGHGASLTGPYTGTPAVIIPTFSERESNAQAERYGLGAQDWALRKRAQERGYPITDTFVDDGYSGGDMERPALSRLRQAVRDKKVNIVLCYDPDRLSRSLSDLLLLSDEFERAGARLEFITQETDASPEGKMFFSMRGVVAEYERAKTRERTIWGRLEKARQGKVISRAAAPFGYRFDPDTSTLIVQEDEAKVVRLAFQLYNQERVSLVQLADRLNRLRLARPRGGQRWYQSHLGRMLRNETYAGTLWQNRWQGQKVVGKLGQKPTVKLRERPRPEQIPVAVSAIVPREVFEAAQRRLDENFRLARRNTKREYLLSGLLKHACGSGMGGRTHSGVTYYHCYKDQKFKAPINENGEPQPCSCKWVNGKSLEAAVWDTVTDLLCHPDLLVRELENLTQPDSATRETLEEELAHLRKCLDAFPQEERRLVEGYRKGFIPDFMMREEMERVAQERRQAEERCNELERQLVHLDKALSYKGQVQALAHRLSAGLDAMSFDERRELLRLLVDEVVYDDGQVTIKTIIPVGDGQLRPIPQWLLGGQEQPYQGDKEGGLWLSQCGQLQTENPPDERKGAICQSCMRHYHSY